MNKFLIYSVEDDQDINDIYKDLLESPTTDVVCFQSPQKCLDILKKEDTEKPDLIIVDLKMPVMSGIEFIRHLKSLSLSIETMVVSGHADKDSAIEALNLGVKKIFEKPFDYNYLKSECFNIIAEKKCVHLEKTIENIHVSFFEFSKIMKNFLDMKIIHAENIIYEQTKNNHSKSSLLDAFEYKRLNKEFIALSKLIEETNNKKYIYEEMKK